MAAAILVAPVPVPVVVVLEALPVAPVVPVVAVGSNTCSSCSRCGGGTPGGVMEGAGGSRGGGGSGSQGGSSTHFLKKRIKKELKVLCTIWVLDKKKLNFPLQMFLTEEMGQVLESLPCGCGAPWGFD